MDRWTIKELKRYNSLEFACAILRERCNKLNPYSPLAVKLKETIAELNKINDKEKGRI